MKGRHHPTKTPKGDGKKEDQLPLTGKAIYLDLKGYRDAKKIEEDLKTLGASIEHSFSKDINFLISNRNEAKELSSSQKKRPSGDKPINPSPFNIASLKSLGDSPADSPGNDRGKKMMTRGQRIANQANVTKHYGSTNVLQQAQRWGVKIVHIESAIRWIGRELTKIPKHLMKSQGGDKTRERSTSVSRLRGKFVKFEASNLHYRPVFGQFSDKNFPQIHVESARGACPFEMKQGYGRENPLAVVERAEHEEERDDRVKVENDEKPGCSSPPKQYRNKKHTRQKTKTSSDSCGLLHIPTAGELERKRRQQVKAEAKQGYCEICEVKYKDLFKHTREDRHRSYVRNSDNYKSLDHTIENGPTMEQFLRDVERYHPLHLKEGLAESQESEYEVNLLPSFGSQTSTKPLTSKNVNTATGAKASSQPPNDKSPAKKLSPCTPQANIRQSARQTRSQSRSKVLPRTGSLRKSVKKQVCSSRRKLIVEDDDGPKTCDSQDKGNGAMDDSSLPLMDPTSVETQSVTSVSSTPKASECSVVLEKITDLSALAAKHTTRFTPEKPPRKINSANKCNVTRKITPAKAVQKRSPPKRKNLRFTPSKRMDSSPNKGNVKTSVTQIDNDETRSSEKRVESNRIKTASPIPKKSDDLVHAVSNQSQSESQVVNVEESAHVFAEGTSSQETTTSAGQTSQEGGCKDNLTSSTFKRKVRNARQYMPSNSRTILTSTFDKNDSPLAKRQLTDEAKPPNDILQILDSPRKKVAKQCAKHETINVPSKQKKTPSKVHVVACTPSNSKKVVKKLGEKWSVLSNRSVKKLVDDKSDGEEIFDGFNDDDDGPETDLSYVEISEAEMTDDSEREWVINSRTKEPKCKTPAKEREKKPLLMSPIKLPNFTNLDQNDNDDSSDWDDNMDSLFEKSDMSKIDKSQSAVHQNVTFTNISNRNESFGSFHQSFTGKPLKANPLKVLDDFIGNTSVERLWQSPRKSPRGQKRPAEDPHRKSPRKQARTAINEQTTKDAGNLCALNDSGATGESALPQYGPLSAESLGCGQNKLNAGDGLNNETPLRRSPGKWRESILQSASSIRTNLTSTPIIQPGAIEEYVVPESPVRRTTPASTGGKMPASSATPREWRPGSRPSGGKPTRRILKSTPRKKAKYSLDFSGDLSKSKQPHGVKKKPVPSSSKSPAPGILPRSPKRPFAPPKSKVDWNAMSSTPGASPSSKKKVTPKKAKPRSPNKPISRTKHVLPGKVVTKEASNPKTKSTSNSTKPEKSTCPIDVNNPKHEGLEKDTTNQDVLSSRVTRSSASNRSKSKRKR